MAAMRVLLHEWCSSGGLTGDDPAIAREGRLMLEALAADVAKDPRLEAIVLLAEGRRLTLPAVVRRLAVRPGDDLAPLVAAARRADWTLLVAPESDGLLLERVRAVRAAGGRVLAPSAGVIELAGDKQATLVRLAGRGIPVPAGRSLAAGEPVPDQFRLPAVRKARGGCGGEELVVIRRRPCPTPAGPTRLEAFAAGTPVGVSLVCGPEGQVPLPVMRQRFTSGDRPRYLGSDRLADAGVAARATALALRTAAAIAADAGWLGVDMIMGERADGRDDRVLEVNPRITTSFVGQTRLVASSLVAAMIGAASGETIPLEPRATTGSEAGGFRLTDGSWSMNEPVGESARPAPPG
jgi:tyramine---L-glutamate ligase